ncbi:MAG: DUF1553 domain-containing protein [Lentisphaeria bacterium]|nr:DUF1553 domain-containing protein [Lentisphaeria bacterium]
MVKSLSVIFAVLTIAVVLPAAEAEKEALLKLDAILEKCWKKHGITPAPVVGDAEFFRRLSFRVRGKLPQVSELKKFIADKTPGKRSLLIKKYLDSGDFALLMAMRYADMFRIKSEFPINLWPNAVQCYHRYFYTLTIEDRSWRQTARELLTSSGSNFRVPPANFFRANADRTPKGLAAGTALALMNFRTTALSDADRKKFEAFFSRIRFKSTKEWKEEIVYNDPGQAILKCRTPDGAEFTIDTSGTDPRRVFADWLTDDENPFFARAYVNRAWYWMFGAGIANPADDMAMPRKQGLWSRIFGRETAPAANAPVDEELMTFLSDYFRANGYSTKKLYSLILNSRAWQVGWRCKKEELARKEKYFAVYPVRRLESEIISDALSSLTNSYERYVSVIPEPFTYIPRNTPAVSLADGSMSTGTLDKFGRSPRDSGKFEERNNNSTGAQRLHLMNSGVLYKQISRMPGRILRGRLNMDQMMDLAYLTVLSRYPEPEERKAITAYHKKLSRREKWKIWPDLFWALVNTAEFSYHH